jgi:hypothetical protein
MTGAHPHHSVMTAAGVAETREALMSAADVVAELVRRADAAAARADAAEEATDRANEYARSQALAAERYRQLRVFVRRWHDAGLIPDADLDDARAIAQIRPAP